VLGWLDAAPQQEAKRQFHCELRLTKARTTGTYHYLVHKLSINFRPVDRMNRGNKGESGLLVDSIFQVTVIVISFALF
jgi:hypothetical protein